MLMSCQQCAGLKPSDGSSSDKHIIIMASNCIPGGLGLKPPIGIATDAVAHFVNNHVMNMQVAQFTYRERCGIQRQI